MSTPSAAFDVVSNASTLIGVVVGALVATLGSFSASWYERQLLRREREADAALVFAEILRSLSLEIAVVRAAHARGDPFGPITIRMCRAVRREVDVYDRNRERLFVLRDARIRAEAGALMGRLTFAIERVLDNTDALAARPDEAERAELAAGRDQAFEFLVECSDELPGFMDRFAALAHTRLADFDLESIGFAPPSREPG
ncbi:MAG TPA: hypothetical protein VHS81_10245 [Caulobacteraceae bacterium]|nr:hypothetical protein [Caulobacteraceae bacterium]